MQWRQLDHTQTICTSVLTDNHTNTSSLNFYRPDALPDVQPTVSSTEGKVAAVLVLNGHIAVASYGTTLTRAGYSSTSQLAVTCPAKIAVGGLSQHLIAGSSGTPKFSPQTASRSVQLFYGARGYVHRRTDCGISATIGHICAFRLHAMWPK